MTRCLELPIFFLCVNLCLFCSNNRESGVSLSLEKILVFLRKMRRKGFSHVTFTGGEPTLHPRFIHALRAAKALGYRTQVVTNGCALAIGILRRKALPLLDELCLSIHGHNAKLHDGLTQNPKSFSRIRKALAGAKGPSVIVNTVANRLNVRSLAEIGDFVCRQPRVRQFWVSGLIPEGRGKKNYEELAVQYKEILRSVPRLAAAAAKRGVSLRFFAIPPCMLGGYRAFDSALYKNPNAAVAQSGKILPEGLPMPKAVKTRRCRGCALGDRCPGIWEAYRRLFGDSELRAVRP